MFEVYMIKYLHQLLIHKFLTVSHIKLTLPFSAFNQKLKSPLPLVDKIY